MTEEPPPLLPESIWQRLRADPAHAPEHLALAAAERHGPAAEAWLADKRARLAVTPDELARMAKRRHATLARFGGAATGLGGIATIAPDLAALAWIQSRMVFFIAAAYGFDPRGRMRPAELLVVQGLYRTPQEARAALDGAGRPLVAAYAGSRLQGERALVGRLLGMVGRDAALRAAGRLVPFVAAATNAVSNERATRRLADKAIAFYGGA